MKVVVSGVDISGDREGGLVGWLPVMVAVTTPFATKTVMDADAEDWALESCFINVTTVTVSRYVCPTCKE